jgi:hypothetical protein
MHMKEPPSTEDLLRDVLASEDETYLEAERRLLEGTSAEALRTASEGYGDSIAELVPHVAAWHEEAPSQLSELDRYFEGLERWFRGKVVGTPPVHGVVEALSSRFGPRLAEVLALRLARMPSAPAWRTLTALGFLERHPSPTATDALIRFATTTTVPHFQETAARVLSKMPDPELARKLRDEQGRLAQAGRSLPGPLAGLAGIQA